MTRAPTEMELRVAKALDDVIDGWYDAQSNLNTVDLARAAIRAMRQETDAMNDAGSDVVDARMLAETGFCGPIWRAMIDAASPEELK